jgi:preprotein translocase subunit YajC
MHGTAPVLALRAGVNPRNLQGRRDRRGSFVRPARTQEMALSALGVAMLAAGGGMFGQFGGIPLLLLMFVAMYFLLIAPNQRKQKTWAAMLAALKPGDRVTTNGGIRGVIVSVKDDLLVVRTAPDGVKLEFVKSAVAAVTTEEDNSKS